MNRCTWQIVIVLLALSAMGATIPTSMQAPPLLPRRPVSFATSFRLLLERNIFDSSRRGDIDHVRVQITPTQPAQSTLTLTGLVYEDGAYSAFVENTGNNTTTKYKIGDSVGGGKITYAGMDYINLATGGRTIHISLGQNMSGTNPVATTNPTTELSPANDMVERLRQRRLQELHQ